MGKLSDRFVVRSVMTVLCCPLEPVEEMAAEAAKEGEENVETADVDETAGVTVTAEVPGVTLRLGSNTAAVAETCVLLN